MLSGKSKRELQKAKIAPGIIVHVFCAYLTNPKNKFLVIVHVDPEEDLVLGLLVNSHIHPIIASNPDRNRCQLRLISAGYPFLEHDSFLDCSFVYGELGYEELANHLAQVEGDYKGKLASTELEELVQFVNSSRTISEQDKELILRAFE